MSLAANRISLKAPVNAAVDEFLDACDVEDYRRMELRYSLTSVPDATMRSMTQTCKRYTDAEREAVIYQLLNFDLAGSIVDVDSMVKFMTIYVAAAPVVSLLDQAEISPVIMWTVSGALAELNVDMRLLREGDQQSLFALWGMVIESYVTNNRNVRMTLSRYQSIGKQLAEVSTALPELRVRRSIDADLIDILLHTNSATPVLSEGVL